MAWKRTYLPFASGANIFAHRRWSNFTVSNMQWFGNYVWTLSSCNWWGLPVVDLLLQPDCIWYCPPGAFGRSFSKAQNVNIATSIQSFRLTKWDEYSLRLVHFTIRGCFKERGSARTCRWQDSKKMAKAIISAFDAVLDAEKDLRFLAAMKREEYLRSPLQFERSATPSVSFVCGSHHCLVFLPMSWR